MDSNDPKRDQGSDPAGRPETPTEGLDRNWAVLLQELRVTQTGVQVLLGFLLTIPFSERFEDLGETSRIVYLVTVACAIASTVLLVAPVGIHSLLFRRHRLGTLVMTAHHLAFAGLLLLGAALTGVAVLAFEVVVGPLAAVVAGVCTAVGILCLWVLLPLLQRSADDETAPGPD